MRPLTQCQHWLQSLCDPQMMMDGGMDGVPTFKMLKVNLDQITAQLWS